MVKAVPTISLAPLAETLEILFAVVVEHVMLTGHIEDLAGLHAFQDLVQGVEFPGFRKLTEVAGVKHECGRHWQGIDFCNRFLQGGGYIWVGRLIEADMAVADLQEAQFALQRFDIVVA